VSTAARRTPALAGRRIVVTRARAQARELRELLEVEGAEVIDFPTIRTTAPHDYAPADRAIAHLGEYRWVVFTSGTGVAAFIDRIRVLGCSPEALRAPRLAAIGPGTAGALRARGFEAELAPDEFRAEALVAAFARENLHGARVLIPRAAEARSVLPDGLRARGAIVDVVPVYRTQLEQEHPPEIRQRLLDGPVDAVTFTSSSTVRNFLALLGSEAARSLRGALVACIGPVTAATAREAGLEVAVVADTYTIPGLVAALRSALGSPARGG